MAAPSAIVRIKNRILTQLNGCLPAIAPVQPFATTWYRFEP